ncbi:FAD dependent oxidoreductase superfamily protein [Xylariales sp. AK1849]|nr:FAD dependent oxidoreductase superfamily protein [Xylariales sp. AK1849]
MGGDEHCPGLPCPDPTVSYWQLPPHSISNLRTTPSLPDSTTFDYVIVGSGISGAAIAHKLMSRDSSLSILMLEARTAASGASGRNGGHCRAGWWLNYKKYAEAFGEDESLKFEKLEEQNVKDIADFVRTHDVACDFQDVETADIYQTEQEWNKVVEVVRMREEVRQRRPDAAPITQRKVLQGEEAREKMGMPTVVGAVTYPAHTQNPYLLVCRMLELSLEKGLNLQTNTTVLEVLQVTPESGSEVTWMVRTDRGVVQTKQVVLATNAYTNVLHHGLASTKFLTPSRNQITAIRPGSSISGNPALRRSAGLNDVGSGDYFMSRAPGLKGEGDVLVGGGKSISKIEERGITDDSKINDEIATYLKHAAPKYFGRQAWGDEGELIRDWTGIVCYTPDTFPLVGEVPDEKGLWMSVGMNGHGMAMAYRSAEALVTMMTTGKEPDWFPKTFRLARAWSKQG